jgi:hypothetical protein
MSYIHIVACFSFYHNTRFEMINQERLGVLAAPRKVRSTFIIARLRSAVPKHA